MRLIALILLLTVSVRSQNRAIDSLLLVLKTSKNDIDLAATHNRLANLYNTQGQYELATENFLNSIKIYEKLKDSIGIARGYNDFGNTFIHQKNFKQAIQCYTKSVDIKEKIGLRQGLAATYNNIGVIYAETGNDPEAEIMFRKSLQIELENKNAKGIAESYQCIATILVLKDVAGAQKLFNQALHIFDSIHDAPGSINCYIAIAGSLRDARQYKEAISYANKALLIADAKYAYEKANLYEVLVESYFQTNQFKEAHSYSNILSGLKDSIYSSDIARQTEELQTKYDTEKKEKENQVLSQKNQIQSLTIKNNRYLLIGLFGLLLLAGTIGFFIFRQSKLKSQQKAMQLEQKLLRLQMNPHFIFNSLAAIESFISSNQKSEAREYLADFAKLMRLILENSREEYITLQKEVDTLNSYLRLQKLNLEDNFTYNINISYTLDLENIDVPPMLIQPFVENSIKHGISNVKHGNINVFFKQEAQNLIIEITDNGLGISKTETQNSSHVSLATTITKERLSNINHRKKQPISFQITDLSTENNLTHGTRVIFTIPIA